MRDTCRSLSLRTLMLQEQKSQFSADLYMYHKKGTTRQHLIAVNLVAHCSFGVQTRSILHIVYSECDSSSEPDRSSKVQGELLNSSCLLVCLDRWAKSFEVEFVRLAILRTSQESVPPLEKTRHCPLPPHTNADVYVNISMNIHTFGSVEIIMVTTCKVEVLLGRDDIFIDVLCGCWEVREEFSVG